jgi:multiple sugar transport system substrate-binding protein
MRKKRVALGLAAALVAGLAFTGCSSSTPSDDGGKVTLNMVYPSDPGAEAKLKKLVAEYQKTNPDVSVAFTFIPFTSWSDYITKVKTMVASGKSPDLLRLAVEGFQEFVSEDLAVPFDSYLADNKTEVDSIGVDQIAPNIESALKVDGKTYGLAWDWNNVVMHVNTKLLGDAGLSLPAEGWTKDDFLNYAQKLTTTKDGKTVYGFDVPNDYFLTTGFLYANGASILNDDMTKSTLDDPKAIEVVQFMHDLIYKYKVSPVPGPNVDATSLFMSGQLAMYAAGRWPVVTYAQNKFTDFDIQYLPKFNDSRTVAFGTGGFPVLKTSKHQEAALKFATWLSASKYSQLNFLQTDSIPSRTDVMQEVLPDSPPANGKIFEESAAVAKPIQAPAAYTDVSTIFTQALSEVYSDQKSAADAMKDAAQKIDAVLKK